MSVNLTEHVVILEQDEAKLNDAIHVAIDYVMERYSRIYLPELSEIPEIGEQIKVDSTLHKGRQAYLRMAVRCYWALRYFWEQKRLGVTFVKEMEAFLKTSAEGKVILPFITCEHVNKGLSLISPGNHGPLRTGVQMLLHALVAKSVILLPAFKGRVFMPSRGFGVEGREYFIDLFDRPQREIILSMTERFDGQTTVDWSDAKNRRGNDYVDWHWNMVATSFRSYAVSFAMGTTWRKISDVSTEELQTVKEFCDDLHSNYKRAVNLYLNCLYRCRESYAGQAEFFRVVTSVDGFVIYAEEYEIERKRILGKKRRATQSPSGRSMANSFARGLVAATKEYLDSSERNDEDFASKISNLRGRVNLHNDDLFPDHGPLPKDSVFDWTVKTEHWRTIAEYLIEGATEKGTKKSLRNELSPFLLYVCAYLPAWFEAHPEANLAYPENTVGFKNVFFVHRLESVKMPNHPLLPMTFRRFAEVVYEDDSLDSLNRCMKCVQRMFSEAITAGDLLGIPITTQNPLPARAIPKSGGRRYASNKADIPIPVLALMLLYSYRLLDSMFKINEMLLGGDNILLSNKLHNWLRNRTQPPQDKYKHLCDLKNIPGIKLDTSGKFDGVEMHFDIVPTALITPEPFKIKGRGEVQLIDTSPLEILIIMMETGLRGQSIQWFDTEFDKLVTDKDVSGGSLQNLWVNNDKVKKHPWAPKVAGRVINLLRRRREFRKTLDGEIFKKKVWYEGGPGSKWGKFFPVFSVDHETGFPIGDACYSKHFKLLMYALQRYVDEADINYLCWKPKEAAADDENQAMSAEEKEFVAAHNGDLGFVAMATPHALRKAVVKKSLEIHFLPPDYIGKFITGQTPEVVGFYAGDSDATYDRVDNHQASARAIDPDRRAVNTDQMPSVTSPHKEESPVVKAFTDNIDQAMHDFMPTSTELFEGVKKKGVDMLRDRSFTKLDFKFFRICPFGGKCPQDRIKLGLEGRCHFCDYAIHTPDHLPGIGSEIRGIIEEILHVESRLESGGKNLTENDRAELNKRRGDLSEELVGLMWADHAQRKNLEVLSEEYRKDPGYFCHTPEIVRRHLQEAPFPSRDESVKYVLSRLPEVTNYPSLNDRVIKAKFDRVIRRIRGPEVDLKSLLDEDYDHTAAQLYSMVHSFMSVNKLTLDQVTSILEQDITQLMGSESLLNKALPDLGGMVSGSDTLGLPPPE